MRPAELKALRKNLGMSQAQLAEKLGIDRVTVARWESGMRNIPPMLALALKALKPKRRKGAR